MGAVVTVGGVTIEATGGDCDPAGWDGPAGAIPKCRLAVFTLPRVSGIRPKQKDYAHAEGDTPERREGDRESVCRGCR